MLSVAWGKEMPYQTTTGFIWSWPGKVMESRKMCSGHGKVMEFHILISLVSTQWLISKCLKLFTENQNLWPEGLFSPVINFQGHGIVISWKGHESLCPCFCVNPAQIGVNQHFVQQENNTVSPIFKMRDSSYWLFVAHKHFPRSKKAILTRIILAQDKIITVKGRRFWCYHLTMALESGWQNHFLFE